MYRETKLLRAVIREDMSMAMVDELIKDITRAVEYLDSHFTININDVHKPEGKSLAVSELDWDQKLVSRLAITIIDHPTTLLLLHM